MSEEDQIKQFTQPFENGAKTITFNSSLSREYCRDIKGIKGEVTDGKKYLCFYSDYNKEKNSYFYFCIPCISEWHFVKVF